jgi:hypothetical protein
MSQLSSIQIRRMSPILCRSTPTDKPVTTRIENVLGAENSNAMQRGNGDQ